MTAPRRRSPVGAMVLGVAATAVYTLPLFLTGALAVELTREFAFGSAGLGIAVAMSRASAAVLTPALGRATDRLGATRSLRVSAGIAAVAALGMATATTGLVTLVLWLMVLGAASAIGLPAANRLLSNVVSPGRLGLAFGIKQSAPPTSSMIAGLSVPVIALTLGWRAAYLMAAGLALIVVFSVGRHLPRPSAAPVGKDAPLEPKRPIRLLTVAFGLSAATTSSVTTFYVDAAVAAGTAQQLAGTVLAIGGAASVLVRVVAGAASDRRDGGHLELCCALLLAGSVGIALLATAVPAVMAFGVVIAMAGAWGFAGVFWFAIMQAYPQAPGTVSGAVFPGALIGGTVGPIAFGVLAQAAGYPPAWVVSGALVLLASGTMFLGARRLGEARATSA